MTMNCKNKYLKHKNKYLELKKNQYGSGKNSHTNLNEMTYKHIETYETTEERLNRELSEIIENKTIYPVKGYLIFDSIDEIIEYYNSLLKLENGSELMDTLITKINKQFGDIFLIFDMYKILYIQERSDYKFFNNLYIYTIMTNKNDKVFNLYSFIETVNGVNFDDFKKALLFLCNTDPKFKKNTEPKFKNNNFKCDDEFILCKMYANYFNTKIMLIPIPLYDKHIIINPEQIDNETDYLILFTDLFCINSTNLLIPEENNKLIRQLTFEYIDDYLKNSYIVGQI